MKNCKFFIGIISHKGSNRREDQLKIWRDANLEHVDFYYFIGDPGIETEYLIDDENKIIYLNVPDNYESLSLKTRGILKFAHENYGKDLNGVLKTDDDIEIDPYKIAQMLENNKEIDYYGHEVRIEQMYESMYHWGKCESDYWNSTRVLVPNVRYCAGGGYYINASLLGKIYEYEQIYESIIFEDVATGMVMNRLGILPEDINVKEHGLNW